MRDLAIASLAAATLLVLGGCASASKDPLPGFPPHHVEGGFRNLDPGFTRPDAWTRWSFFARRVWASTVSPRRYEAPRIAPDVVALREGRLNPSVTWIGHSTLLIQLDGMNILTDPHWGDRASPVSWAGPRRLGPPGLRFEDLPRIDVVLLSHDHYDHLDRGTARRLAGAHDPLFIAPLGLKRWLEAEGITRVEERDWWQSVTYRGVTFHCVPAQHFGGRTLADTNSRLWASWAVHGRERRLFFGGDSGYFDGFRQAGERLGPFDLAALAIGAYLPPEIMRGVHTTPEEAVQGALDLRARMLLGIHWGTFDLAEEPLDEPPARMLAEAARRGLDPSRAWVLGIGETRRW